VTAVDCSAGGLWCCGDVEVDSDGVVALCLCGLAEKREGRGVFIEGLGLLEGLGFARWGGGSDGGGELRARAGLSERDDRRAPPVSL
jgi:hypothetical protein